MLVEGTIMVTTVGVWTFVGPVGVLILVEGAIMVTRDGALILVHKEKVILVSAIWHWSIILMVSLCRYVVVVCFSKHNQGIFASIQCRLFPALRMWWSVSVVLYEMNYPATNLFLLTSPLPPPPPPFTCVLIHPFDWLAIFYPILRQWFVCCC